MARTFTPKVGHRVTYFNAAGKPMAAKIMSVGSTNGGIVLRLLATATNIGSGAVGILRGSVAEGARANVWSPR
jgi:hypothetical protein